MRAKRVKAALVMMVLLAGWGSYALADTAATVDPAQITWTATQANRSIGWRFFVDQPITITHLGLFDRNDDGLTNGHTMGIWRVKKTGGLQLERQVDIPSGGTPENHYVWVALAEPFTIIPDPEPWEDPGSHILYYERWLVGVWSGTGNLDPLEFQPETAATLTIEELDIIRFENYTFKDVDHFDAPWGSTQIDSHFAVNFKYGLVGPSANAGPDVSIYTSEQAVTTIYGSAAHTVPGTPMTYQWFEGTTVLGSGDVNSVDGTAPLSLASPVPALALGAHTLTLEVTDGTLTSSDTMVLTVSSSPPHAQLAPETQVVEVGLDAIIITAEVADFDGDTVSYQWVKDGEILDSGTVTPPAGGNTVSIEDLSIAANDPRFPLGENTVDLIVNDGVNPPVTTTATVSVQDTHNPTICPIPSRIILWPPDGQLKPVTVWVFVCDNGGGGAVTLSATVESSRPPLPGETDWYIDSIDQEHNIIQLRLRAERRLPGVGRVYKITVTATDGGGNTSSAVLRILAPRHGFDRPWWW